MFAYDATFDTPPPVFAYDATFDTPLQRGGSQAAPAESIAALPTVTVTDTALVCPICTDPLLASAPVRRLPCSHLYHSDCIVTWLSLRNSCPVCGGSIPMFHSAATDSASSPSPPARPAGDDLYQGRTGSEGFAAGCLDAWILAVTIVRQIAAAMCMSDGWHGSALIRSSVSQRIARTS
jgi:hypothetical protein